MTEVQHCPRCGVDVRPFATPMGQEVVCPQCGTALPAVEFAESLPLVAGEDLLFNAELTDDPTGNPAEYDLGELDLGELDLGEFGESVVSPASSPYGSIYSNSTGAAMRQTAAIPALPSSRDGALGAARDSSALRNPLMLMGIIGGGLVAMLLLACILGAGAWLLFGKGGQDTNQRAIAESGDPNETDNSGAATIPPAMAVGRTAADEKLPPSTASLPATRATPANSTLERSVPVQTASPLIPHREADAKPTAAPNVPTPTTTVVEPVRTEAAAPPSGAETDAPADVLDRLKGATVFIKVTTTGGIQSGSGFLLERDEQKGVVVTNAHVLEPESGLVRQVDCVFHSGTRDEFTVKSSVIGADPVDDLALLAVEHVKLPTPLAMDGEPALRETLPVLILGFPFGQALTTSKRSPAITVAPATISSIRRDDYDHVALLQLDGGINPGNSGGPVVTPDGKLVGIAVAKVRDADIGFAVPKWVLVDMLLGRPTRIKITQISGQSAEVRYQIDTELVDPRNNISAATFLTCPSNLVKQPTPNEDNACRLANEQMTETSLEIKDGHARGIVAVSRALGSCSFQIRSTRKDGTLRYTPPLPLKATTAPPPNQVAVPSPPPPSPRRRRPTPPEELPIRVTPVPTDATALVAWLAWSRDEMHLFSLSKNGLLQKFSLDDMTEVQRADFSCSCSFLGKSQEGLVVVFDGLQQVVSVDEESLEIRRQVRVPGASRVASAPATSMVYVPDKSGLTSVDLSSGKTKTLKVEVKLAGNSQRHARFDTKYLTATPDGKYLFAEGGIESLQRMRVSGDKVILEEASPRIGQNAQEIVVSPDSKFVAMPSGGGNYPADGHPPVGYGTYIYAVDDLQSPYIGIKTGAYPRMLGFDPVAKKFYAQNYERHLIVVNSGGVIEGEFTLAARSDVRRFLVHPQGHRLCVLTEMHLLWVELESASEPLVKRISETTPTNPPEDDKPAISTEPQQAFRTWTDSTGSFRVTAKLLEIRDNGIVVMEKKDGTQAQVPLSRLSKEDQEHAKQARLKPVE